MSQEEALLNSVFSWVELVKLCYDVNGIDVRDLWLFMQHSILGSDSRNIFIIIRDHSYSKKMGQERWLIMWLAFSRTQT